MKTEKNILIAFILNFAFSIFEFFGGIYTGSVAIISDALHDLGDAASIGISFFLEKKSKKRPDNTHTYGYARYSVLGSIITTLILLLGSVAVITNAVNRIVSPKVVDYHGMIFLAIVGVCVNTLAAFFTREKESLNQKAVNLHMLEDILGWIIVLIGAIVMRYTDFTFIDPIISIAVAIFIIISAFNNLKEAIDIFLVKTPDNIDIDEIRDHIEDVEGVINVHHIHIWTMDGQNRCATMHIVTNCDAHIIKETIRGKLKEHGIDHVTLEIESENEHCHDNECHIEYNGSLCTHHHGHHH